MTRLLCWERPAAQPRTNPVRQACAPRGSQLSFQESLSLSFGIVLTQIVDAVLTSFANSSDGRWPLTETDFAALAFDGKRGAQTRSQVEAPH